ncbi:hypothetical protein BRADI_3g31541v3 [Brachypodium distachyon]|uniref:Uncharacterized protein n=1 Tax=Brachypodium distachyon TaxID=15368 RepID=A0A2K2D0E2_BRADI|nr:hypothetical protein BRADI_3g31541v3 [Brachypodium distachyon]
MARGEKKIPLDELVTSLHLREDEEEDIVLEEDPVELAADARWMALARVCTTKTFSHGGLFGDMRSAWNPAKEVQFRPIQDNLFSVQFNCLADWE